MRILIISLLLLSNTNFSVNLEGSASMSLEKRLAKKVIPINKNHEKRVISTLNKRMRKRETGEQWTKVNSLGYIGYYQFGKGALEATGYAHITVKEFIKDPNIWPPKDQEQAMNRLVKINTKLLNKYIEKYTGDTIKGIVVTKSGLLAAAHLAGAGSVKKRNGVIWFLCTKGTYDPEDAYGTKLSDYLSEFANLD